MFGINNLMDMDSMKLDFTRIQEFESVLNTDLVRNNTVLNQIEPIVGRAYTKDFYGLLHNVLNVPNIAYYINMRINGLRSSLEYDGFTDIYILDPGVFEKLYDYFEQNKKLRDM